MVFDCCYELSLMLSSYLLVATFSLLNAVNVLCSIVSESTLHSVAAGGSVEVFRLVSPMESNHHKIINFYLDEVGLLKKLPLNARASQYALKAGFNPAPQFYGDIYVGRVQVSILRARRTTSLHLSSRF